MLRKQIYLIIVVCLFTYSCKKVFSENINSFMYHIKDDVYLDHSTRAILVKNKIGEDSYILGQVIVDHIDSIYIDNNKSKIYIINDKNEYIWLKPDLTNEKLKQRPNVNFSSVFSYHD